MYWYFVSRLIKNCYGKTYSIQKDFAFSARFALATFSLKVSLFTSARFFNRLQVRKLCEIFFKLMSIKILFSPTDT